LHDYHEDGLEEKIDCEAHSEPEEHSENIRDEQDGTNVDRERADRFLLFDDLQLWEVGPDGKHSHRCI